MSTGPMRTCTGCRRRQTQDRLIRVRHAGDGRVSVGSGAGRGAYVCFDATCVQKACRSGSLARTLRLGGPIPEDLRRELTELTKGFDG
jgi:predicted RNA-binding protein YlxR (DUF448 family)